MHTTTYGIGSSSEPILVSDEEDALLVERELSRWSESSSSSASSAHSSPHINTYVPCAFDFTSLPLSTRVPSPAGLGSKRKWSDLGDPSHDVYAQCLSKSLADSKKRKKKRKKDRSAQASSSGASPSNVTHSSDQGAVSESRYMPPSHLQSSTDSYSAYHLPQSSPIDFLRSLSSSYVSPEDEYRPDGPLWLPSEQESMRSAYAASWAPQSYYPSSLHSATQPSLVEESSVRPLSSPVTAQAPVMTHCPRPSTPTPTSAYPPQFSVQSSLLAEPSQPSSTYSSLQSSSQSLTSYVSSGSSTSDVATSSVPQIAGLQLDHTLSERLRELQALSASLLSMAGSSSQHGSSSVSIFPLSAQSSPPPSKSCMDYHSALASLTRKILRPVESEPEPEHSKPAESWKRLIGIPEDKAHNGYFDLTTSSLEPPPSLPIRQPVKEHTLVMAHLPKKFRKHDFVMAWAKRFGTPDRVIMDSKVGKCLIEWVGPIAANSAFTSLRLRGDGKEHIRLYRYLDKRPPPPTVSKMDREMEEGELEEGEVAEISTTTAKKKKKNKGKKRASELMQTSESAVPKSQPLDARTPGLLSSSGPSSTAPTTSVEGQENSRTVSSVFRFPGHAASIQSASEGTSFSIPVSVQELLIPAVTPVLGAVASRLVSSTSSVVALAPVSPVVNIERPTNRSAARDIEEEEMELESDEEREVPTASDSVLFVQPVVRSTPYHAEEDMDLEEDDMDLADDDTGEAQNPDNTDMDLSSPTENPPLSSAPDWSHNAPVESVSLSSSNPSPRKPPEVETPSHPHKCHEVKERLPRLIEATRESVTLVPPDDKEVVPNEVRRRKLNEAIARTKAQLSMRESLNARRSLPSSTSESPEPLTPMDSPIVGRSEVVITSTSGHTVEAPGMTSESVASTVAQSEASAAKLDALAASFIADSIQTATASRRSASPVLYPVTHSTLTQVRPAPASATSASVSIPVLVSTKSTIPIPLSEEEKQHKQKRWLEMVSSSKSLMDKIARSKVKEEKDLLMRLLQAKMKSADEIKREIDSGFQAQAQPQIAVPSPRQSASVSGSATPTPVPSSQTSSATPTPTPTPAPSPMVALKRPVTATSRWPETAAQIVVIVSDDEADDYQE